jgi:hypothetical protein
LGNLQTGKSGNAKEIIKRLIKKQIKNHPAKVAESIHIIGVTKKAGKWLFNGCN